MRTLLFALPVLAACKGPPDAPATLDDLCSYMYSHLPDEDPAAMEAASDQIQAWMEANWQDTEGGYTVSPLDQPTVEALDAQLRNAADLTGIAVVTTSNHTVDEAAYAMVMVSQSVVYPDTFVSYDRTYIDDPECFMSRECTWLQTEEQMDSQFVSLITITSSSHSINQYIWTDSEVGISMVHRNWLTEQPDISPEWLGVTEQYYLQAFLPREGGHYRLQAMWVIYASDMVPTETGLKLTATNFETNSETLEAWLDANPMP